MRLFISVDMEGISGIEKVEECFRGMPGIRTRAQGHGRRCERRRSGRYRWRRR